MLSIEYVHKRARLFRIELSLVAVACLRIMLMVWQLLMVLRILKEPFSAYSVRLELL